MIIEIIYFSVAALMIIGVLCQGKRTSTAYKVHQITAAFLWPVLVTLLVFGSLCILNIWISRVLLTISELTLRLLRVASLKASGATDEHH